MMPLTPPTCFFSAQKKRPEPNRFRAVLTVPQFRERRLPENRELAQGEG
jgi:hypothetical protein